MYMSQALFRIYSEQEVSFKNPCQSHSYKLKRVLFLKQNKAKKKKCDENYDAT